MKTWLLGFFILPLVVFGQDTTRRNPKILFGLKDLHEVDSTEIYSISGDFTLGNGFGGISYIVNGKGEYKKRDISCLDDSFLDSGSYKMNKKRVFEFVSKGERNRFIIYRFDKYYFLVPVKVINVFKKDFLSYARKNYELKPGGFRDERYTDQFFIAFTLVQKYFVKLD